MNFKRIIILSLLLKLAYLVFAVIILREASSFTLAGYCDMIQRNDSGWYEIIATNGYPEISEKSELGYNNGAEFKQSEWAFFPFYPLMIRGLMNISGLGFALYGLIWSLIFSTLAIIGFHKFVQLYVEDQNRAYYFTLLFLFFPFHYYFSMMYTEAVYFTFLIFSFLSIYKNRLLYLPVLIIPLVLVRPNGIVGLIPLYLFFLERNKILVKYSFNLKALFSRGIILKSLLFVTGPLAFLAFSLYQKQMTGYYFAFSIAQQGWYREFMLPFMAFFRRGDFTTQFNSVYTIVFILMAILGWKKFPLSLNVLIWTGLLLPLCSGSVTSMPRFISVIFPFTILIGAWLFNTKYKYYFLEGFAALQFWVFYYWLTGHPFSC